jgi:fructose-bisphosphate aldolase, class II
MKTTDQIMHRAAELGIGLPAFNIAYLPMTEPVIRAVADEKSFALLEVSRIDWTKMGAKGIAEVAGEFRRHDKPACVRLHLDHVPVIDEDGKRVDYMALIRQAVGEGYGSVMIDGSRLPLEENIRATREAADCAHGAGIACEAELGAVLGHEAGPLPPYEELFATGRGFTRVDEAERFVKESGCDWLSVAIGNIHGAVSGAARDQKKAEARLNIGHLDKLRRVTGVPLVLHGGSGVLRADVLEGMKHGIAKINVGTEIRQTWEHAFRAAESTASAQEALYSRTRLLIREYFNLSGIGPKILA